LVLLFGVGAPMFLFGMGALVRDFHLPLPIDSQGFFTYVAYYLMLLVLLFGVHAPVLIFGMGASMIPYCRYFCILFFVISASLWSRCTSAYCWYKNHNCYCWKCALIPIVGISASVCIVKKVHRCILPKKCTNAYCWQITPVFF
jgi:uncharacterized membrane protein